VGTVHSQKVTIRTSRVFGLLLVMSVLMWPTFSPGESGSNAKVCEYLPIPELEAHFAAKATSIRGRDGSTMSTCGVDLPDRLHGATLTSKPPGTAMSVEQRLAPVRKMLEGKDCEIKNFGSVRCFTERLDMGDQKLPSTTCFQDSGGYLSLGLVSDDPKKLGFESVKPLLEKAAGRRK